jgi:hypothetical protein
MPKLTLSPEFKRILTEALTLSDEERLPLADYLSSSVVPFDPEVEAKVMAEVRERIRALKAGEMETNPAEEVFEELRKEFGTR